MDGDVKKVAFGYFVLGFAEAYDGPLDTAMEWLREEFERKWRDVGESGRRLLEEQAAR